MNKNDIIKFGNFMKSISKRSKRNNDYKHKNVHTI